VAISDFLFRSLYQLFTSLPEIVIIIVLLSCVIMEGQIFRKPKPPETMSQEGMEVSKGHMVHPDQAQVFLVSSASSGWPWLPVWLWIYAVDTDRFSVPLCRVGILR
jgi:hypothetical protein